MKRFLFSLFMLFSLNLIAQTDYYTKKGVAINGYDVTSYFEGSPTEGMKQYAANYDGTEFYFSTLENKKKFEINPVQYLPQYGGYCAYAIGLKSEKVKINPETYEIRDGKLYLFYNSWGTNTLELWNEKGPQQLQSQADINWEKIKNKK